MELPPERSVVVVASLAGSLINFRGHLLAALVKQGYKVTALAPSEPGIVEKLMLIGVDFREIPLRRNGLDPISDIRLVAYLYREFRKLRPTIVFSYTIKPVIYGSIAARLARVPVVVALITGLGYAYTGDSFPRRCLRAFVTRMYRTALRKVACVFFQNRDDLKTFLDMGVIKFGARVAQIDGSGVDVNRFGAVELPPKLSFLMISRLLRDKGVYEYVAASRSLRQRHPYVRCMLVGALDSNPSSITALQVREWEKEGAIEYLGELQDVRPAIAACSVYVLPSYREGMPRTVLEAMAMGRGVITTDAPGCKDSVIDGESGLIVPVGDANALLDAMTRCVQDPESISRMGSAARDRAVEVFDVRKVNAEIMGVFEELLAYARRKEGDDGGSSREHGK